MHYPKFETLGKLWNLERELERSNKIGKSTVGDPKPQTIKM